MATDKRDPMRPAQEHTLSLVRSFRRPGQWVECFECSCGWASPDIQFPTWREAFEWALKEHGLDRSTKG